MVYLPLNCHIDFMIVLRPEMPKAAKGKTKIEKKRKREESDGGDEEDEDRYPSDSEEDTEIPDPDFKIPASYHPSSQNPTWRYRYRARETGEGEILLDEDENIYTITFSSEIGEKLSGTIQSTLFDEIVFTGHKMENAPNQGMMSTGNGEGSMRMHTEEQRVEGGDNMKE